MSKSQSYQLNRGATTRAVKSQWNGCVSKKRWPSKAQARSAKLRLIKTYPHEQHFALDLRLAVYACRNCGAWHIGHSWVEDVGQLVLPATKRLARFTEQVAELV